MGKVGKAVKKGVKKVGKAISSGIKDVGSAVGSLAKKGLGAIGGAVSKIPGLDSLGKEIERWGEDINQVIKVYSGEYHDDVKRIEGYQKEVERIGGILDDRIKKYNLTIDEFVDRMESLVAFEEIFQMAIGNRLTEYQEIYGPELDAQAAEYNRLVKELNVMIRQLKSEYDFVIGLTEGAFLQRIIGSLLMIIGGLHSDMGDVLAGRADSATWKRLITTTVMVIAVVLLFFIPGLQGVALAIAVSLAALNAFMTLDGMYANGAATGAIMGILDFVFNDVLNLDDLIGRDFDKFDRHHEDYAQMVGYVQLAIALAQIYTSFTAAGGPSGLAETAGTAGATLESTGMVATEMTIGQTIETAAANQSMLAGTESYLGGAIQTGGTMETTMFLGVKLSTYSNLYKAYTTAQQVGDVIAANKLYEDTKAKMKEDLEKLNSAITTKLNKSMMGSYKDAAYFLQDQQANIDSYIWSMTAQNMYVDPYGTTPVANIRFTPDKDTRMMSFGFEDVFDESRLAGSQSYFNNIIYGS